MTTPEGLARSPASRPTWRALLDEGQPLLLPAAHDAVTTRLIARGGCSMNRITRGVLLDVDGTLVDSNDAQAHA